MKDSSIQAAPQAQGDEQQQWPRDFDVRAAYAEQRELLDTPPHQAECLAAGAATTTHK